MPRHYNWVRLHEFLKNQIALVFSAPFAVQILHQADMPDWLQGNEQQGDDSGDDAQPLHGAQMFVCH